MKKHLLFLVIFFSALQVGQSQTSVSGGIYTNTTWTLAGSPYTITDTVVVFPGVTLTIQPGVVVKFDNDQQLEIRQAQLIANGTAADSVTFTSSSASPSNGIYVGIYINGGTLTSKFNYCSLKYAAIAINAFGTGADSLVVGHSSFNNNLTGLRFFGDSDIGFYVSEIAVINSSVFKNNTDHGIFFYSLNRSSIDSCRFSYNGTGLESTGNTGTTKNCTFDHNQTGLGNIEYMSVSNCSIVHNQTGISSGSINKINNCSIDSNSVMGIIVIGDSLLNCSIQYNGNGVQTKASVIKGNNLEHNTGTGISDYSTWTGTSSLITDNTIRYSNIGINNGVGSFVITKNIIENNNTGIKINNANSVISCNSICNNTTYGLQNGTSSNLNASHNYWCTLDSVSTEPFIYDGYDNISLGIVSILPFDSVCAPNPLMTTSVQEMALGNPISIYPNPFSTETIIQTDKAFKEATLTLYNVQGQEVKQLKNISGKTIILNRDDISNGLYFLQIIQDNKLMVTKKLIVTD